MRATVYSLFFSLLLITGAANAQDAGEAALKAALISKAFVFKPQSAWPLQGTVIQLNAGFDLKCAADSLVSYLPYFGRSYSSGYNSEGGINFTSTSFEYKLKEKSKGGWELDIKPADATNINRLLFTVSKNGYASLQVLSTNRQAISFYGLIEKLK